MATYIFGDYQLDSKSHQLSKSKVVYSIRPKTVSLLLFFLENPNITFSKNELFQAIWGTEYVHDHTLFQLISELRKLLPSETVIKTYPNVGYRWVYPVSEQIPSQISVLSGRFSSAFQSRTMQSMSLCMVFMVVIVSFMGRMTTEDKSFHSGLPAIQAFTKGIIALENGDSKSAVEWLSFSVQENPEFEEAHLMLAESLLSSQRMQEARNITEDLLSGGDLTNYSRLAASELLKRIHWRQGETMERGAASQMVSEVNSVGQHARAQEHQANQMPESLMAESRPRNHFRSETSSTLKNTTFENTALGNTNADLLIDHKKSLANLEQQLMRLTEFPERNGQSKENVPLPQCTVQSVALRLNHLAFHSSIPDVILKAVYGDRIIDNRLSRSNSLGHLNDKYSMVNHYLNPHAYQSQCEKLLPKVNDAIILLRGKSKDDLSLSTALTDDFKRVS